MPRGPQREGVKEHATVTDEDIVEILASPLDWDAFTIAHARRIATSRAINTEVIKGKSEARTIEKRDQIKAGKTAPTWLLVFGWAIALMGGLVGIGVGYSLAYMKEQTPEGNFYTYDERSRRRGGQILLLSVAMLVLWIASM